MRNNFISNSFLRKGQNVNSVFTNDELKPIESILEESELQLFKLRILDEAIRIIQMRKKETSLVKRGDHKAFLRFG